MPADQPDPWIDMILRTSRPVHGGTSGSGSESLETSENKILQVFLSFLCFEIVAYWFRLVINAGRRESGAFANQHHALRANAMKQKVLQRLC